MALKNTQRGSQADHGWKAIPELGGHCQEGPVSCSFFPGLSRRKAPQLSLLALSSDSGRSGWGEAYFGVKYVPVYLFNFLGNLLGITQQIQGGLVLTRHTKDCTENHKRPFRPFTSIFSSISEIQHPSIPNKSCLSPDTQQGRVCHPCK